MDYEGERAPVRLGEEEEGLIRELENELEGFVKKIKTALDNIVKSWGKLVKEIREWWPNFEPLVQLWVSKVLNALDKAVRELVRIAKRLLKQNVPVLSLIYASFAWLSRVREPVTNIVYDIDGTENRTPNIVAWKGDARTEYNDRKKEQVAALKGLADGAKVISAHLMAIAVSNIKLLGEIASCLAELALEVAATARGGSVGAAQKATAAIEAVTDLIGVAIKDAFDRLGNTLAGMRNLTEWKTDNSVFGYGKWPNSVAV